MAPGAALAVGAVTTRGRVVEGGEQPQVATDEAASVAETVAAVGAAASVAETVDTTAGVRGIGAVGDETVMMAAVVAVVATAVGTADAGAVAASAVAMVHLVPPRTLGPLEGSTVGRREVAWTLRSWQHWPRTPKHWKGLSTERAR